ncbi:hypothetical protein CBR_g22957 [Chara braunii]|uniref:PH domain-containing protein n=1 Tax=Chara braunii TaxID=69332 RepID=A0A388L363_CHABU|nr:hypothetical protein CBR_g22957 [Chara braunii]|eukprot:GBG76740.1 hypothetical protein CBR_g22957 [Chara braunii]
MPGYNGEARTRAEGASDTKKAVGSWVGSLWERGKEQETSRRNSQSDDQQAQHRRTWGPGEVNDHDGAGRVVVGNVQTEKDVLVLTLDDVWNALWEGRQGLGGKKTEVIPDFNSDSSGSDVAVLGAAATIWRGKVRSSGDRCDLKPVDPASLDRKPGQVQFQEEEAQGYFEAQAEAAAAARAADSEAGGNQAEPVKGGGMGMSWFGGTGTGARGQQVAPVPYYGPLTTAEVTDPSMGSPQETTDVRVVKAMDPVWFGIPSFKEPKHPNAAKRTRRDLRKPAMKVGYRNSTSGSSRRGMGEGQIWQCAHVDENLGKSGVRAKRKARRREQVGHGVGGLPAWEEEGEDAQTAHRRKRSAIAMGDEVISSTSGSQDGEEDGSDDQVTEDLSVSLAEKRFASITDEPNRADDDTIMRDVSDYVNENGTGGVILLTAVATPMEEIGHRKRSVAARPLLLPVCDRLVEGENSTGRPARYVEGDGRGEREGGKGKQDAVEEEEEEKEQGQEGLKEWKADSLLIRRRAMRAGGECHLPGQMVAGELVEGKKHQLTRNPGLVSCQKEGTGRGRIERAANGGRGDGQEDGGKGGNTSPAQDGVQRTRTIKDLWGEDHGSLTFGGIAAIGLTVVKEEKRIAVKEDGMERKMVNIAEGRELVAEELSVRRLATTPEMASTVLVKTATPINLESCEFTGQKGDTRKGGKCPRETDRDLSTGIDCRTVSGSSSSVRTLPYSEPQDVYNLPDGSGASQVMTKYMMPALDLETALKMQKFLVKGATFTKICSGGKRTKRYVWISESLDFIYWAKLKKWWRVRQMPVHSVVKVSCGRVLKHSNTDLLLTVVGPASKNLDLEVSSEGNGYTRDEWARFFHWLIYNRRRADNTSGVQRPEPEKTISRCLLCPKF